MVGLTVIKEATLDVKPPSKAFIGRGWRFQPWKTRHVQLVDGGDGNIQLQIYKDGAVHQVYALENITDITMVTSKTHLHAFEVISNGNSLIVLSGTTELESRDWIWTLRKIFWPQALAEVEQSEKLALMLVSNTDTRRLGLPSGVYNIDVSVVDIRISLQYKCLPSDSRSTQVESFSGKEDRHQSINLPLTTIGRLVLAKNDEGEKSLVLETTPDGDHGRTSFEFTNVEGSDSTDIVTIAMDNIKSCVFRATNNLHDLISSSQWRLTKARD